MTANLLILGGTLEATALCARLAQLRLHATLSLAGRVARPKRQPLPLRVGGFGGESGLTRYLKSEAITHVIDATHPFAAQMSRNAIAACAEADVPLVALTRAPWQAQDGDRWTHVHDMAGAVAALDRPRARVLLAVGRMHLAEFTPNPQHHYVLRLIDPPETPLPFPDCTVTIDRGPFTTRGDTALMKDHRIDLVVSKNSGGSGAVSKITAARSLGLPVIMIDRPDMPPRNEVHDTDAALSWLASHGIDLGV
ncbi:MAG: cobalt-precorrin-6A reductase [Jhaorihella sp.]